MIKIVIENPHWAHRAALIETANYLLKMAEVNRTEGAPTSEVFKQMEDEIINNWTEIPKPIIDERNGIDLEIAENLQEPVCYVGGNAIQPNTTIIAREDKAIHTRVIMNKSTGLFMTVAINYPLPEGYTEYSQCTSQEKEKIHADFHSQEDENPAKIFKKPEINPIGSDTDIHMELDTRGFPWDERIHARTKTKNKDGSWKYLRGVGPKTVEEVEGKYLIEKKLFNPPPPIPVPNNVIPIAPPIVEPELPKPLTFTDIMTSVTNAIKEKKLNREGVNFILKDYGLVMLSDLSKRPDLFFAVNDRLQGVINNA